MSRIITFKDNGVDKITDYSDSSKTGKEIIESLHKHSYRANLLKRFREQIKGKSLDEMSDNTLAYELECLVKAKGICSTISEIEFHHNKTLKNFGVKM